MNHIDNYGLFPLKKELYANNLPLFKQLLEKGANPNMIDEFQRTVMHLACD
jgi:ankyrin repeat protein